MVYCVSSPTSPCIACSVIMELDSASILLYNWHSVKLCHDRVLKGQYRRNDSTVILRHLQNATVSTACHTFPEVIPHSTPPPGSSFYVGSMVKHFPLHGFLWNPRREISSEFHQWAITMAPQKVASWGPPWPGISLWVAFSGISKDSFPVSSVSATLDFPNLGWLG